MLGAMPIVIEPPGRREPRVHPGPSKTGTLFIAPPMTHGITNNGEHITSHSSPLN